MSNSDNHPDITRRDFLNGVSVAIGAALLPGQSQALVAAETGRSPHYPPSLTGMRGAHPGSFEAAHAAVKGRHWPPGPTAEHYDLVIVGAGISGLSAAWFYRRDVNPEARILILDNHDDFGGHAKRNEFSIDGRTIIGFGGTMLMESPASYPPVASELIRALGIDPDSYHRYHHDGLFKSLGLERCSFFDKGTFGADHLARQSSVGTEFLAGAPLSERARQELSRLYADRQDYLVGKSPAERRAVLESNSYGEYLARYAGIGEEAMRYLQKLPHGVWAIGSDAMPAWLAWTSDYPGFAGMDPEYPTELFGEGDDGIRFHFPDGNASIARLLVRSLVPASADGDSMEDIVTAQFDYASLDRADNPTRIRLNSTVVDMAHRGEGMQGDIQLTCTSGERSQAITAGKVIWAGYHALVPHICPDVPASQAAAMRTSVRAPLVYTNVLIRNWRSLAKLGMHRAYCPGSFFHTVRVDFPVSIGNYRFSSSPDEPVLLHLQHIPLEPGLPAAQQFRSGRRSLLETPFATFEAQVRDQLGRMLGPGGFQPDRDIAAITVNRWPHGYAYSVDPASGDVAWWPDFWQHAARPWEQSRQRIGNIAFANTDASSNAMTESAIVEAHRAVRELFPG